MTILGSLTSGLGLARTTAQTDGVNQTTTDNTALHQKLHEEYVKLQAQKAMQAQNAYTTSGTISAINPYLTQQQASFATQPTINLEEGAWDVPISQLVDLWTVRFGSKWVSTSELDEFYSVAVTRLNKLNKVEAHYVNGNNVYRIVE